jgi:hypothetical protein
VVFTGWSLGVGWQTVHRVKSAGLPGYGKMPLLKLFPSGAAFSFSLTFGFYPNAVVFLDLL